MITKTLKFGIPEVVVELNYLTHQEYLSSVMSGQLEEGPTDVARLSKSCETVRTKMKKGLNYYIETLSLLFHKKEDGSVVLNVVDLDEEQKPQLDKVRSLLPRSLEIIDFVDFLVNGITGNGTLPTTLYSEYWEGFMDQVEEQL